MEITDKELLSATPADVLQALKDKKVFIAGAGGLGSNVANMLLRAGIGGITVADYDVIEPSNINRQFFFYNQIGRPKVEALRENLTAVLPDADIRTVNAKLTEDNFEELVPADCDIIFECFDNPAAKASLVQFVLQKRSYIPLVAVSGIAGSDHPDRIRTKQISEKFYLVGDLESGIEDGLGTLSTRVMCAAAVQAHVGIQILMKSI